MGAGEPEAAEVGAAVAAAPRRLHPLSPIFDLFDRNLLFPAVIAFGSGGLRILVAALVVIGLFRALSWSRRTYVLDGRVLRVESGVLARNEQLVPCDRVQQVNLVQKLRHRIAGVAALRVEVAGGGSGVELDVLGLAEASALRVALLAAKAEVTGQPSSEVTALDGDGDSDGTEVQAAPAPSWVPAAWPVVRLSYAQLVLAGLTGSELFVIFAFAATATQLFEGVPEPVRIAAEGLEGGVVVTVLLILAFVVVWLGAAIAAAVLRDAGYALDLVGDELHLSRGLLDRKEAVLPLARVQAVHITASPLRRPLGYVSLRIQSASVGSSQEERRVSVPILPARELPAVLDLVLPGSLRLPSLQPAPRAALRRKVVRATWPVLVVAAASTALAFPQGLAALALVLPAAGFGVLSYRGLGHALGSSHVVSRSGAIVRRTVVVPLERAQSCRVRSTPFQRRVGLATCFIDVAGPGRRPAVIDVAEPTAEHVADRAVAAVARR